MRRICCNKEAVSNVLGYLISFMVAASVMTSSVLITTNIIDDKTTSVAEMEAQSLANKVADALVEAVESKQSMPEASYQKTLDVPMDLAGKSYYIETTSTKVYVNTTDGAVSKSSTTYSAEGLNIGISGRVYSGHGEFDLTSNKSDFAYKLDFGTGNSTDHSPVESGYCMVSDRSAITQSLREPPWWNPDYHYRIPIKMENDASEELEDVPVKIVLDTTNFDYSNANVNVTSSSTVSSDLVFIDSGYGVVAEVEISPDTWYTWWLKDYLVGDIQIEVTITGLSEGYDPSDIYGDSIKLNGVSCKSWDDTEHKATFDPQEALLSLGGDESEIIPAVGEYTITISGSLNDWTPFYGGDVVTVALANILVDDDADPGWYDATHVKTVQEGIDNASSGDSVFVYNGEYNEQTIAINKEICLVGESRDGTIISYAGVTGDVIRITADNVYIDSVTVRDGLNWNMDYIGNGIHLDNCHDVSIINCNIHDNEENGILVQNSWDNKIINCNVYGNGLGPDDPGDPITPGVPDAGIYLYGGGSKRNIVRDCSVFDNDEIGIWLNIAWDNNIVENCSVYYTGGSVEQEHGIRLEEDTCHDNIVRNCTVYSHTLYGIYLYDDCYLNTITNCEVYGNKIKGISLVTGCRNIITNCEIYDNANQATADGDGIFLSLANQNTISNCVIYHNGDDGIHMNGELFNPAYDNTIVNCAIYDNGYYATVGGHGINFYLAGVDSHPNVIDSCTIYNNTDEGIHLIESGYNVIKNCNVFDNGGDGIQILGSDENTITYCNCFDNGDDGIHLGKSGIVNSVGNTIEYCNLYCNGKGTGWGVGIYTQGGCSSNYIHYNNFAEQENDPAVTGWPKVYNAYDWTVVGNDWDGNYWDDYVGGGWHYIPASAGDNNPNAGTITRELSGSYDNPDVILVDASYGFTDWYHKKHIEDAVPNVRESGVVMVYPGIYNNEDIVIDEETSLIGLDKDGVRVKGGGSGDVITVTTSQHNVLISSLNISGGDKGICIDGVSGLTNVITISDCKIHDNNEDGIYNDYPRVKVIDCEIYNNDEDGIHFDSLGGNSIITNCDIHRNNNNGIYLGPNADSSITITNCDSYENDNNGIYLYQSDENVITGCSFYDNDYDDSGDGNGITLEQSSSNNIIICDIYDNTGNQKHGIHLDDSSNYNEVANCDIYDNKKDGVSISTSTSNEITRCNIRDNLEHGIQIKTSSDSNEIKYCIVEGNTKDGIRITSNSDSNEIKYCDIYSNTQHGIYIRDSNSNQIVDRNSIRDNDYGIYISGSSNNNEIHHNNFENNNYSAHNTGSNIWHTGYPSGGNHWDNYDESYEGAYDFYNGPLQDILGSDGIVDIAYPIPGDGDNRDMYPFGGGKREVRPYYIDYWNPYGQSIILVNMSLKSHAFKYIYMYYGYDEPLGDVHNHSISEISVFSDDFNNDLSKWTVSSSTISGGYVTIGDEGWIVSNPSSNPSYSMEVPGDPPEILYSKTVNDSMHIVEARMNIEDGQGNMYFLADGIASGLYDQSYMVSANATPVDDFTLFKMGTTTLFNMDNDLSVPDLNHWLRMKSYIYMSKTCYKPDSSTTNFENTTVIDAYLYNYDTFADEGNVSGWDTDIDSSENDPPGELWAFINSNFIGLGAGLHSAITSKISVDWVRVMKTPIVPPTVSIGSTESSTSNYGWTGTPPGSENRETFDPFNPGPVLCDFNNGTTPATFVVNLPEDTYTITVTMGDKDAAHGPMYIKCGSATVLTIPETEPGEFETKWFTKNWGGGDLNLEFSGTNWAVNSMLIERGYKGIKIE